MKKVETNETQKWTMLEIARIKNWKNCWKEIGQHFEQAELSASLKSADSLERNCWPLKAGKEENMEKR